MAHDKNKEEEDGLMKREQETKEHEKEKNYVYVYKMVF